ncbi:hypothetical protein E1B28_009310 [Marasmius oreades]|uniref:Uncharacterized protein n=1 Tax=Marasmius oreades TaxID=181124 RepID=A0A9P7S079_9AGAR|nr:uncharacterized protein E1B28_009310 [Marasmius oreades]KAG7093011.1 hypothetical protein E1B28_009310 [Marasmius oreades]
MSEEQPSDSGSTRSGHLGKTWEIAVVIAVVVVVVLSTITVVITYRRRRRRRQQEVDSETGKMSLSSAAKRGGMAATPWGFNSKRERPSQVENVVENEMAKLSPPLSSEPPRPSRTANSDTSSSQKPKYYWNER